MPEDDGNLDGCDLDFTEDPTEDGEQVLGTVLFADVAGDVKAVATRERELTELHEAGITDGA